MTLHEAFFRQKIRKIFGQINSVEKIENRKSKIENSGRRTEPQLQRQLPTQCHQQFGAPTFEWGLEVGRHAQNGDGCKHFACFVSWL